MDDNWADRNSSTCSETHSTHDKEVSSCTSPCSKEMDGVHNQSATKIDTVVKAVQSTHLHDALGNAPGVHTTRYDEVVHLILTLKQRGSQLDDGSRGVCHVQDIATQGSAWWCKHNPATKSHQEK
jgi:hypothetical protein